MVQSSSRGEWEYEAAALKFPGDRVSLLWCRDGKTSTLGNFCAFSTRRSKCVPSGTVQQIRPLIHSFASNLNGELLPQGLNNAVLPKVFRLGTHSVLLRWEGGSGGWNSYRASNWAHRVEMWDLISQNVHQYNSCDQGNLKGKCQHMEDGLGTFL